MRAFTRNSGEDTSLVRVSDMSSGAGNDKRVREGSITLDGYDAQSLEVARQVGTELFMIKIDHLIRDDYVCNPL